ncbi:hypothetical protein AJ78_02574 [Emergomyces pasteurianus Ep9510]|uniref:GED domain-containing protein n=1 Tax=Emergomyces pasteurianus Ep9510 TaxID=1447872 RepID=A0A1J9PLE4_9EURO|nr:hypothetical protein AJ78_02574 [Emergomyces pasteurianus Ep9510]
MVKLLSSLQNQIVNMEQQACGEVQAERAAYYKVRAEKSTPTSALKVVLGNVCCQVVERHIVRNLRQIFTLTDVLAFSDKEVELIASEPNRQAKRVEDP